MAEIRPFHALRYDPSRVPLQKVVTQPYDKITPAMQDRYYSASPYNLVRVILGKSDSSDQNGNNVYSRAAKAFAEWQQSKILVRDSTPSIYGYSQHFAVPGGDPSQIFERRSFIAVGRIYDYSDGIVFRHEHTLSKPKADRLNLLRATQAHFGQIFMLYSDPAGTINRLLFDDPNYPQLEVADEYGVLHRVRRITDPAVLNMVCTAMADRKLIIADGHHRYETALNYRNEVRNSDPMLAEAACFVMMTFVNMDEPGLVILPTHRLIFGLKGLDDATMRKKLDTWCERSDIAERDSKAILNHLFRAGEQRTAFVAITKNGNYLLRPKIEKCRELLKDLSPRQQKLDVVQLHRIVLEAALGISEEHVRQQTNIRYLRDANEAIEAVHKDRDVNTAFLINPIKVEQMRDVAFSGEVMPQKSTDFYPKLLSGLTIYSLQHESHAESSLKR
jgi:uncharacterized protein (DUF1015 family)